MKKKSLIPLIDEPFKETGKKVETKKDIDEIVSSETKEKRAKNNATQDAYLERSPYDIRDAQYSAILSTYNTQFDKKRNQTIRLREYMYHTMMAILVVFLIALIVATFFAICNKNLNFTERIISIIALGVEMIGVIIAIPVIIAKNLFPSHEDKEITEVLSKLIENDINIRTTETEQTKDLKNIIRYYNSTINKNNIHDENDT